MVQTQSNYETANPVTSATGEVGGHGKVYRHTQILSWDYNLDDYKNVNQTLDYKLMGPFATFQGITEKKVEKSATSFTATLAAEYAAEIAGFERGGEARIVSRGDEEGTHEVLTKKAPTS
ncbi:chemotaxis protein [Halogeometricum borinquense]|uniref:Chemotaxis protein n=1 Tax=Halogeometricum borinquense TaxID=60847 RepID=A0A482T3Q7_9EURY|nr:chemotaxis protein [Halogeometricum borinquense]